MYDKTIEGYIQILLECGVVMDVSLAVWDFVKKEIESRTNQIIEFEDIYGGASWFNSSRFIGARHWTVESGIAYEEINRE